MTAGPDSNKSVPHGQIPAGWRLYVIGDVHGRADLLETLLQRIDEDISKQMRAEVALVFLGDYIDRGPASKIVIDILLALSTRRKVICLKGNHEAFLIEFFADPGVLQEWRRFGGLTTLMSYGLHPPAQPSAGECGVIAAALQNAMPKPHRDFLLTLHLYLTFGDYFFVHAGVRPGIALDQQGEADLLWIREDFLLHEARFEKIIVHGHSPVLQPEVLPNRINIDTGAYATGRLTCLVLEGDRMRFL